MICLPVMVETVTEPLRINHPLDTSVFLPVISDVLKPER
jgi:hypothetical protein